MIATSKLHTTTIEIANKALKSIHSEVGPYKILAICDHSSISHKGYIAIFKTFKIGLRHIDPKFTQYILLNPH